MRIGRSGLSHAILRIVGILILFILNFSLSFAQDATQDENDLKTKIEDKTVAIKELEAEIEAYQKELESVGVQKNSLQNEIKQLDITRKKLTADISLTENKISRTNLKLEQLTGQIDKKTDSLNKTRQSLAETLRLIHENEQTSFTEMFLVSGSINQFADKVSELGSFSTGLNKHILEATETRRVLEENRVETSKLKLELVNLRNDLGGKRRVVEYNKSETNNLLVATKNNEANYKKLLDEKVKLRDAFERELLEFESQLKLLIDPSTIPDRRRGLLNWPLEKIKITQPFGDTEFSRANSYVYNGKGHNGVDFGAPTGTIIKSVSDGEVVGIGDTDAVCPGASYGKWILIEHDNGPSTLYAHLSVIGVSEGAIVNAGDAIGYVGNTGYSTGPHLHFTVYATQGVEITERKSRVCLGTYKMPLADLRAYLDPMWYLPELP